jgi:tetrapyrrole methylase family protein/MazG family protein
MSDAPAAVTIVGLGPGDASLLTGEARDLLASADEVWLRTKRHPAVRALPTGPAYESFDAIYDGGDSFDQVYEEIVARVLDLARRPQRVIYAVPGHPLFGETTVRELLARAREAALSVRIVAGLSFLDSLAAALGIDPLADGLLVLDALALGGRRRLLVPRRPTVVAQVYDRRTASHAKLALLEAYPPGHAVRIVRGAGTGDAGVINTTVERLDREDSFDHLATLYVPPLALTDDVRSFEGVRAVVARLRDPDGGCPWDLEQTHETLKRFLLEEAYEALDALDQGEPKRIAEELGDLLMQVVLHAQLGEDAGEFVIEDVFASIATKLVRRHPHVFGNVQVQSADDVLRNWETLKSDEREGAPLLDAVPKAMAALQQARSVQSRASKAQLGPPPLSGEALTRSLDAFAASTDAVSAAMLGDLLFGIVALAGARDLDAEEALRMAVRRFRDQVAAAEARRQEGDST